MDIIQSIILGVIEGITEFLPISSTAHLIITSKLLNIPQTEFQKFFEVFIQSGAILAVIFLYLSYILKHKEVIKKVTISFIPTAVIGFFLYKIIKNIFFESFSLIIFMILSVGFIFLIVEYLIKKKKISLTKNLISISFTEALFIGLGQSLAVIPGVSRAGIIMIVMMILGYKRDQAALYSFLLAVPTILAASFFDFYKMKNILFSSGGNVLNLIVGFVVSFITAYLAIKWLVDFLKKNSLNLFGAYRILLAIILMILP